LNVYRDKLQLIYAVYRIQLALLTVVEDNANIAKLLFNIIDLYLYKEWGISA